AGQLVTQPLGGGEATRLDSQGSGKPAAPVYLAGCAYGAWTGSQRVARDCPGDASDLVRALEGAPAGELVYRVNHDFVILNELSLGSVWLASENFELFDDWSDVLPSEGQQEEESDAIPDTTRDPMLDRDKENRPPTAEADSFGVRPGRSTILRVLDNDADPDGDALVASPDDASTAIGPVQPVYGGAALQVVVPEDATGSASFSYTVDDGRENGTDSANVRLEVHGWDRNEPPQRLRERDLVVARGAEVTARVLEDWADPDGDDLVLVSARTETKGDEVRFMPDGTLTFRDAGTELGRKAVAITVSDGREKTEGTVWVEVLDDQQPPVARVDHAVTTVGEPVDIFPLLNDTDPNGDELRLARVDDSPPALLTRDYDAGTVTLVSDVERVYYLTYLVTDGPSSTLGLIRVDVVAPADGTTPPVAVKDTALLPADGSVLVDVLANDHDPAGGILVLQSVEIDPVAGLSVEVVDHHLVRITAVRALEGPVSLSYTVSNGLASAVGEVLVIPVPAPEVLRPPVAHPDEAVVRAGDIVTIPVLKNDEHPDNAVIELVPELVELPDAEDGLIFTTGDAIRFHAGPEARTVRAVYEIVDPQGQKDSAQVTIHVRATDPEHNVAPSPRDLEARVLAGSTVRIPVPTAGLDPDGDRVTLLGLETAPTKGRVTAIGAGWMDYEANATSTGTDTFRYRVADALGARATAAVTVGIAPSSETNLPPLATDDVVYVRPDRLVAVPVLLNDVDPEGGQVRLVTDGLELPEGLEASVQHDRVLVRAPLEPGAYTLYYAISDALGARAVGALTVDVSGTAPLRRPVAVDDEFGVAEVVGKDVDDVPVLDNDDDPDGFVDELVVTLPETLATGPDGLPVASVSPDGSVKVTLTEQAQIIPYSITDQDGLSASAFVLVPGITELPPALSPDGPELSVVSGEQLSIDLRQHVVVADGRTMGLTEAGKVTAVRGTGAAVDHQSLSYVSEDGYVGPAAISFEVGDGPQDDPSTQTSVLSLPITVLPRPEVNSPPTARGASVSVEAGTSESVDLATYAADADEDELTFALVDRPGAGIDVSLDGTVITVTADNTVRKGTRARATFSVSDGEAEPVAARIDIEVTGSRAPLATVNLDRREDVHQGEPVTLEVLTNDKSPFPGDPLQLIHAELDTGEGTVAVNGSNVVVTPSATFVGTLTARYTVADATQDPDRNVDGRIEITVLGRPGEMAAPTVEGVRSQTVVLSWTPPVNNGSVITHYEVLASDGKTFECKTTTCTLEGLTNDLEYTFTVVAHNAVGASDPSPASAPARPDERPDPPAAPTLEFG
ncbi:MAG: Ig-like domain-containing protein, partial [Actinomycetota bacterium]|nr:Ig-like domain-containing protein [Actinomycetota bacterium]